VSAAGHGLGVLNRQLYGLHKFVDDAHLFVRLGLELVQLGHFAGHDVGRLALRVRDLPVDLRQLDDEIFALPQQPLVLALGPVDLGPEPVELVQQALAPDVIDVRVIGVHVLFPAHGRHHGRDVARLRDVPLPHERGHHVPDVRERQLGPVQRAALERRVPFAHGHLFASQHHADLRDPVAEQAVDERPEVGQHVTRDAHQQRALVARVHGHLVEEPLQPDAPVDAVQRGKQLIVGRVVRRGDPARKLVPRPPPFHRRRRTAFVPEQFVQARLVAGPQRAQHALHLLQVGLGARTRRRQRPQPFP